MMDALKAVEFPNLLAFLLPGLVAARAFAYIFTGLGVAYEKAASGGDGAVMPTVLLLLAALTCGVTISVLRQQSIDPVFGWARSRGEAGKDRDGWRPNYAGMREKDHLAAYGRVVVEVYRYYQFIGNMSIALLLLAAARLLAIPDRAMTHTPSISEEMVTWTIIGLAALLFVASFSQFLGWCRVHNQICPSPTRRACEEADRAKALARSTARTSSVAATPTRSADSA